MRVVLVRHGQTDYNLTGRMQGQIDIPLNEVGLRQAKEVAPLIALQEPSLVISSPLVRARKTAEAIADAAGVQLEIDARLIERGFGRLEGLTREQMEQQEPELYRKWLEYADVECAESRQTVGDRVAACIRDVAARVMDDAAKAELVDPDKVLDLDEHEHKELTVVLVTHGSAIANGLATLLGIDPTTWSGFRGPDNCHWSVVIPGKRNPGWRLVEHNTRRVPDPDAIQSRS